MGRSLLFGDSFKRLMLLVTVLTMGTGGTLLNAQKCVQSSNGSITSMIGTDFDYDENLDEKGFPYKDPREMHYSFTTALSGVRLMPDYGMVSGTNPYPFGGNYGVNVKYNATDVPNGTFSNIKDSYFITDSLWGMYGSRPYAVAPRDNGNSYLVFHNISDGGMNIASIYLPYQTYKGRAAKVQVRFYVGNIGIANADKEVSKYIQYDGQVPTVLKKNIKDNNYPDFNTTYYQNTCGNPYGLDAVQYGPNMRSDLIHNTQTTKDKTHSPQLRLGIGNGLGSSTNATYKYYGDEYYDLTPVGGEKVGTGNPSYVIINQASDNGSTVNGQNGQWYGWYEGELELNSAFYGGTGGVGTKNYFNIRVESQNISKYDFIAIDYINVKTAHICADMDKYCPNQTITFTAHNYANGVVLDWQQMVAFIMDDYAKSTYPEVYNSLIGKTNQVWKTVGYTGQEQTKTVAHGDTVIIKGYGDDKNAAWFTFTSTAERTVQVIPSREVYEGAYSLSFRAVDKSVADRQESFEVWLRPDLNCYSNAITVLGSGVNGPDLVCMSDTPEFLAVDESGNEVDEYINIKWFLQYVGKENDEAMNAKLNGLLVASKSANNHYVSVNFDSKQLEEGIYRLGYYQSAVYYEYDPNYPNDRSHAVAVVKPLNDGNPVATYIRAFRAPNGTATLVSGMTQNESGYQICASDVASTVAVRIQEQSHYLHNADEYNMMADLQGLPLYEKYPEFGVKYYPYEGQTVKTKNGKILDSNNPDDYVIVQASREDVSDPIEISQKITGLCNVNSFAIGADAKILWIRENGSIKTFSVNEDDSYCKGSIGEIVAQVKSPGFKLTCDHISTQSRMFAAGPNSKDTIITLNENRVPWMDGDVCDSDPKVKIQYEDSDGSSIIVDYRYSQIKAGKVKIELSYGSNPVRYTFTDGCGKSAVCEVVYEYGNVTPPVVDCDLITSTPLEYLTTRADECEVALTTAVMSFANYDISYYLNGNYNAAPWLITGSLDTDRQPLPATFALNQTYIIGWVFTDASGNETVCRQKFTVKDNVAPVPTVCPEPAYLKPKKSVCELAWNDISFDPQLQMPMIENDCDGVIYASRVKIEAWYGGEYVTYMPDQVMASPFTVKLAVSSMPHFIHWIFVDKAGNESECVQELYINDITAPIVEENPNDNNFYEFVVSENSTSCSLSAGEFNKMFNPPMAYDECDDLANGTYKAPLPVSSIKRIYYPTESAYADRINGESIVTSNGDADMNADYQKGYTVLKYTFEDASKNVAESKEITIHVVGKSALQFDCNEIPTRVLHLDKSSMTLGEIGIEPYFAYDYCATDALGNPMSYPGKLCSAKDLSSMVNENYELKAGNVYTLYWIFADADMNTKICPQTFEVEEYVAPQQVVAIPDEDHTKFVYTGSPLTYYIPNSKEYKVSGNVKTEPGIYKVVVSLADEMLIWEDGTKNDKIYEFVIEKTHDCNQNPIECPTDLYFTLPVGVSEIHFDELEINPMEPSFVDPCADTLVPVINVYRTSGLPLTANFYLGTDTLVREYIYHGEMIVCRQIVYVDSEFAMDSVIVDCDPVLYFEGFANEGTCHAEAENLKIFEPIGMDPYSRKDIYGSATRSDGLELFSPYKIGDTYIYWVFEGENSKASRCTTHVFVKGNLAPVVPCETLFPDVNVLTPDCDPMSVTLTPQQYPDQCVVDYMMISEPYLEDENGDYVPYTDEYKFPLGKTFVHWIFWDYTHNVSDTCHQSVHLRDQFPPDVDCDTIADSEIALYGKCEISSEDLKKSLGNKIAIEHCSGEIIYGEPYLVDPVTGSRLEFPSVMGVGIYPIQWVFANEDLSAAEAVCNRTLSILCDGKVLVDIPVVENTEFTYDAKPHTLDIPYNRNYTVVGSTKTAAGKYVATVSLNNTDIMVWADGSVEDKTIPFVINKAQIEIPAEDSSEFVYNGKEHFYYVPESPFYLIEGNVQTSAGRHYVSISLLDHFNYMWTSGSSVDLQYDFMIKDKEVVIVPVSIPTPVVTEFVYNGKEQTVAIPESQYYTVRGESQTLTGSYTVIISLNDKKLTTWEDGTVNDKFFKYVIEKERVEIPSVEPEKFVYSGDTLTLDIPANDGYSIIGNSKVNAGEYVVKVSLDDKNNTVWTDGTVLDKVIQFTIEKATVEMPILDTTEFVYSGDTLIYSIEENEHYTVEGNVQTEVGTYKVVVSLNDQENYIWNDGSSRDLIYTFEIKAPVIIKTEIPLPLADTTPLVYNGDLQLFRIVADSNCVVDRNMAIYAGKYMATVSLKDTATMVWADGTLDDILIPFEIAKSQVEKPVEDTTKFIFTGDTLEYNIPSDSLYTVDGNIQSEVGSYDVVVSLNDVDNYEWNDGTVENLLYKFVIVSADEDSVKQPESIIVDGDTTSFGEPGDYIFDIVFDSLAHDQGFVDVKGESGEEGIKITIPEGVEPGVYDAIVTITYPDSTVEEKNVQFKVPYPNTMIVRLLYDVLAVDNTNNQFVAYQWYKNGKKIEGATRQFYCDLDGIRGVYKVQVVTTSGDTLFIKERKFNYIAPMFDITLSKNPVSTFEDVDVRIEGITDSDILTNSSLVVYDMKGVAVINRTAVERTNTISIGNVGEYIVVVRLSTDQVVSKHLLVK